MILRDVVAYLAALDPNLPWAALSLAVFGIIYAIRKFLPSLWLQFSAFVPAIDESRIRGALRKIWQALPGVAMGAVIPTLASGGDVKLALYGAVAGAFAPFIHEIAAALPFVPYKGEIGKPKPKDPPDDPPSAQKPAGLSTLALAMVLAGCSGDAKPDARDAYQALRAACLIESALPAEARKPETVEVCAQLVKVCTDPEADAGVGGDGSK